MDLCVDQLLSYADTLVRISIVIYRMWEKKQDKLLFALSVVCFLSHSFNVVGPGHFVSEIYNNLKLMSIIFLAPFKQLGPNVSPHCLKSVTSSFVLLTLREKLFS